MIRIKENVVWVERYSKEIFRSNQLNKLIDKQITNCRRFIKLTGKMLKLINVKIPE